MAVVLSVAALAALDPQLAPAGITLIGLLASVAALAALVPQLAPVGVALARCWWCLGRQLVSPGTVPMVLR